MRASDFLAEMMRGDGARKDASCYGTVRATGEMPEVLLDGASETIPCWKTSDAHYNDRVLVQLNTDGRPVIVGNFTTPSVNDAEYAEVKNIANEADALLDTIAGIEQEADKTLEAIIEDSVAASKLLEGVEDVAEAADKTLAEIIQDAEAAGTSAAQAEASAAIALDQASAASASAIEANANAVAALTSLSTVEDVVGTLNWISEHGTFAKTRDVQGQTGKHYFSRSGSGTTADPYRYSDATSLFPSYELTSDATPETGKPYFVVEDGQYVQADVSEGFEQGVDYYENALYEFTGQLDETVQNYLASHLAMTDEGLWVTKDGQGCHLLIANNRLSFRGENGVEVAYIAVDENGESTFYMTRSVVVKNLRFSKWEWRPRMVNGSSSNLSLKWTGKVGA